MYITVMSFRSFVTQDFHTELMQNKFVAVINRKLVYIYVLDKALPRVLYGKYSMKRLVERQMSRDQSLSAIFVI